MSIPTDDDTKREIVFPTFRPVYNGVSGERRTAGETQYERRIVGKQQVTQHVPVYETTKTFTGRVEVPVECHVNVSRPSTKTIESVRRIERDFPLIEEEPEEVLQPIVYDDKIVEVPTTITVIKPVYKKEVRELIREVPKIIEKTVDRLVEIPDVQYVYRFAQGPPSSVAKEIAPYSVETSFAEEHPFENGRTQFAPYYSEHSSPYWPPPEPSPINYEAPCNIRHVPDDVPHFYHPGFPPSPEPYIPPYDIAPPLHSFTSYSPEVAPSYPIPSYPSFPYPVATTSAVDIDVPVPVPVPVYMDYPVDVPIGVPTPTPVAVGQRIRPVYTQSGEVRPIEVFVPKPQFAPPPCDGVKHPRGRLHVTGYRTLHDNAFHLCPKNIDHFVEGYGRPPSRMSQSAARRPSTSASRISNSAATRRRNTSSFFTSCSPPPPYPLPPWP